MLTYLTAGESHGPRILAILDGFPAGFRVDVDVLNSHLARRQGGYGRGGRMKIEKDQVQFTAGLRHGVTTGNPIGLVIENRDWENWKNVMDPLKLPPDQLHLREKRLVEETTSPRPGHADLAGGIKFGHRDLRNVLERASARETAIRTAVGTLCRQLLEAFELKFGSHVVRIGSVSLPNDIRTPDDPVAILELAEQSEVRCIDSACSEKMVEAIREAKKQRDSLGGIVEVVVSGLPAGLGGFSQARDRLDSRLAAALMSIPSAKAVEIGLGFEAAERLGSEVHDEVFYNESGRKTSKGFYRKTNRAGGIEGGVTNGENIIARVSVKPISTLNKPLKSVDVIRKVQTEAMVERTDNCVVPAVGVIAEAVAALELCEAFLAKFGGDSFDEIRRHYQTWLETDY